MIKLGVYTFYSKAKDKVEEVFDFDQLALLSLSVLEARKHFKRLYLFTDDLGVEVLNNALDLPFDWVGNELQDFLPKPYAEYWGMAKIKSYSSVVEPFVHIDNDVILYNGLPDYILEADLVGQSTYVDNPLKFLTNISYVPPKIAGRMHINTFYNCGICGGNNWEFFQELWDVSYTTLTHLANRNPLMFKKDAAPFYNIFLEEFYYSMLAKDKKVTTLFPDEVTEEKAIELGYTHLAGDMKKDPRWRKRVRAKLLTRHENEFYKLQEVCQKLNIPVNNI